MSASTDPTQVTAADGTALRYRRWPVSSPRAAVLVVHGLGEHSGRYAELAQALNAHGVSVFAPDLRGHGLSAGRRGHARSFEELLMDLDRVRAVVEELAGGVPIFMLGQSFGGLLALRYAETRPDAGLRGLVLSSPLLRLAETPPGWLRVLARIMNGVLPVFHFRNRIDPRDLSHDEAEVAAYAADPLVHDRITPRLYAEMAAAMSAARADLARLTVPDVLVLVPGADPVVDPEATLEAAAEMARTSSVDVRGYSGFFHEPFHERDRQRPIGDVTRWITARTG